jgi:hypothetical protein
VAAHFDRISRPDVFALDADALQPAGPRRFKRPHFRFSFTVFDFHVDPGVWDEQVNLGDFAFHRCPFRQVVVAVRMVGLKRHNKYQRTNGNES